MKKLIIFLLIVSFLSAILIQPIAQVVLDANSGLASILSIVTMIFVFIGRGVAVALGMNYIRLLAGIFLFVSLLVIILRFLIGDVRMRSDVAMDERKKAYREQYRMAKGKQERAKRYMRTQRQQFG